MTRSRSLARYEHGRRLDTPPESSVAPLPMRSTDTPGPTAVEAWLERRLPAALPRDGDRGAREPDVDARPGQRTRA